MNRPGTNPAWINTWPAPPLLAVLIVVACVGIAALGALITVWSSEHAARLAAVPIESDAPQCPAPARAGEVLTITFTHDGNVIKHRCQLVRDWQLLNPRAKRPERITP